MNFAEAEVLVRGHDSWHHAFEIYPGVNTKGSYNSEFMIAKLDIPDDLRGLTILDVGRLVVSIRPRRWRTGS